MEKNWHAMSAEQVAADLGVDVRNGLTQAEAEKRIGVYGSNRLEEKTPRTFLQRFIDQMKDAMVLILLAAAGVSFAVSWHEAATGGEAEWIEPIVIVLIVLINGILGVAQESRAEEALAALKKMSMPRVRLRRGARQLSSTRPTSCRGM